MWRIHPNAVLRTCQSGSDAENQPQNSQHSWKKVSASGKRRCLSALAGGKLISVVWSVGVYRWGSRGQRTAGWISTNQARFEKHIISWHIYTPSIIKNRKTPLHAGSIWCITFHSYRLQLYLPFIKYKINENLMRTTIGNGRQVYLYSTCVTLDHTFSKNVDV